MDLAENENDMDMDMMDMEEHVKAPKKDQILAESKANTQGKSGKADPLSLGSSDRFKDSDLYTGDAGSAKKNDKRYGKGYSDGYSKAYRTGYKDGMKSMAKAMLKKNTASTASPIAGLTPGLMTPGMPPMSPSLLTPSSYMPTPGMYPYKY